METIAAAAFRSPRSGTIYKGVEHLEAFYASDIYQGWVKQLGTDEGALDCAIASMTACERSLAEGFVTSTGRFVDREEAARIARTASQGNPQEDDSVPYLLSEDLDWMEDYADA